jgi:hypothetical protein
MSTYYAHPSAGSPYINRFIQPDSIVPDPANPQSLNRFSYVFNNPILYTDPSGHVPDGICLDGVYCGIPTNSSYQNYTYPVFSDDSGESESGSGLPGGGKDNEPNPCLGNVPYRSEFACGITITEPSFDMYLTPPASKIVDDFTDFEWEGKTGFVNRQPITPIVTSGSRAIGIIELFLLGLDLLHYNTNFNARVTKSYTQGLFTYMANRETGKTALVGLGVYNNTGYDMIVTSVIVDKQPVSFSAYPVTPNGYIGVVDISPVLVGSKSSIDLTYIMTRQTNNTQTTFGFGSLRFSGHIGP